MTEIQKAFEQWFDSDLVGKSIFDKDKNGNYKYSITCVAFGQFKAGWHAAMKKNKIIQDNLCQ